MPRSVVSRGLPPTTGPEGDTVPSAAERHTAISLVFKSVSALLRPRPTTAFAQISASSPQGNVVCLRSLRAAYSHSASVGKRLPCPSPTAVAAAQVIHLP